MFGSYLGPTRGDLEGTSHKRCELRNVCGPPEDVRAVSAPSEMRARRNPNPATTALREITDAREPITGQHTEIIRFPTTVTHL